MASLRGEAACTDRSVGWGWLRLSTSPRGETLFGSSQCPKSSNTRSEGCLAWPVPGVVPCTNATCRDLIQMRPSGSAGWPRAASAAGAPWGCSPHECAALGLVARRSRSLPCEATAVTSVPLQPRQGTARGARALVGQRLSVARRAPSFAQGNTMNLQSLGLT